MSNVAGKAYAMNLVTPIKRCMEPVNRAIFWLLGTPLMASKLDGLLTLSMIHYARWVIVPGGQFPRLSRSQPRENTRYTYMLFFSNFNGSWAQYIDSFAAAIPSGLDLIWFKNVKWPKAVPESPFHRYVEHNQIWTDYYYSAYPLAASNDVKSAKRVKDGLRRFIQDTEGVSAEDFVAQYGALLKELQLDLSQMDVTPAVSMATQAAETRRQRAAQVADADTPQPDRPAAGRREVSHAE
jgi:hypothetical protein